MFSALSRSIVAAVLVTVSSASTGFAATDCSLKQIASVPAEVTANNELLIEVTINEIPVKLRVDTGGATSALNMKFAERVGLPVETMPGVFYGLTGRALDRKTRVGTLRLGNTVSRSADFALMPIGGDGTDGDAVGLFGADYLQSRSEIILWFDRAFAASFGLKTSGGKRAPSGSSIPSLWRACDIG